MKNTRAIISASVVVMSLAVVGYSSPQVQRDPDKTSISQSDLTLSGLKGDWTAAVRLESGEILTFERINIDGYQNRLYGTVWTRNQPIGYVQGAFKDNAFSLLLTRFDNIDPDRSNEEVEFEGHISGDKADGTVKFIDGNRNTFKGTFTFARYGYKVTPPTPKDPGGSGVSAISGAWQGEFVKANSEKRVPLTLDLKHQGADIVGTGTVGGAPSKVVGTFTGSAFTLLLGDSSGGLKIKGEFTNAAMVGDAIIYVGKYVGADSRLSGYGKVTLRHLQTPHHPQQRSRSRAGSLAKSE